MLKAAITATVAFVTLAIATRANAQAPTTPKPRFELVVPSGTVVARGANGHDLDGARLTAIQASYGVRPNFLVTSTVGWARSTPFERGQDARLDVFTYDAGVEYRPLERRGDRRLSFTPFVGTGGGARSYSYRHVDLPTTHDLAAYASAGGELGVSRVRVRVEVRDYLTWASPDATSNVTRRNDVAVLVGVRLAVR